MKIRVIIKKCVIYCAILIDRLFQLLPIRIKAIYLNELLNMAFGKKFIINYIVAACVHI